MGKPSIIWDLGTAYDFFMSLHVLHEPNEWGLRGAWAAGVRSRLSAENRTFLKESRAVLGIPLYFIHTLPATKNAQTALDYITQIPVADRLAEIYALPQYQQRNPKRAMLFKQLLTTGRYSADDVKQLYVLQDKDVRRRSRKENERLAYWLTQPSEFGTKILPALTNYFEVFFAEEEVRLQPFLATGLAKAQELAKSLTLKTLLEQLSNGVTYSEEKLGKLDTLILAPSFWTTPFVLRGDITPAFSVYLFGARPDSASLVPGEVVPDALYRTLKALADPTRLKIMKYLTVAPHTPTDLAQKLRLRPPTVIHHLHIMRLAQLVYVHISAEGKRYAARVEAIQSAMQVLDAF
ncbi:MAG TPA: ArsR family transcriptional regulator, partial [Anaerolineae bacterium]|nr:ArsR family transcriptional regulator [Anaerolineae bacterium]